MRGELADNFRQLRETPTFDPKRGELALELFDFMAIALNRRFSAVKLVLEREKPFDIAVERPYFRFGRGTCPDSERQHGGMQWIDQFTQVLAGDLAPHLLMAQRLLREVA